MSLNALKIQSSPLAFAEFAEKHNALIDVLNATRGENGISVCISEKNAIIRGNIANGGGGGGGIANLAFAAVVTSDGRLQNVLSNTNVTNTYPATGKWVTASGNIVISNTGLTITSAGGKSCTIAFAALTQNVALRADDYCDSNVSKSQLHIASAPYT